MRRVLIISILGLSGALIAGCNPSASGPQPSVGLRSQTVSTDGVQLQKVPSPSEKRNISKLMEMERRDKDGNVTGLNEDGLWYKRGERLPYTGIVAGYYKAKDGKEPIMASMREYSDGVQVGTETSWYENGKKRIELAYENGEAVQMKQWDADGKELK
jgi:hypothetical protein